MKSQYFTHETIQTKAREIRSNLDVRTRNQVIGNPALLVLDMQKYFLEEDSHAFVPSGPAIIPQISQLIELFKSDGLNIIFTKHINSEADAGNMATWWRDLLLRESPYSALCSEFQNSDQPILEKPQYDAFYQTALDKILRSAHVTDVIITGVMTHLCCETTARSAFMRGYRVWFPVDGTATYNEDLHLAALRNLNHGFANIPLVIELLALVQERSQ